MLYTLDPDTGAVPVPDSNSRTLDAIDHNVVGPDHERGLAFDCAPFEVRAGFALDGDAGHRDERGLIVDAGRQ